MSITPKPEFIERILQILCRHCHRRERIRRRLEAELVADEPDYLRYEKVDQIIREET